MNDPRSMMIGWGALLFAAGSGYYFARKDLNERRREQARQGLRGPAMDWREKIEQSSTEDASRSASDTSHSTPNSPKGNISPSIPSRTVPNSKEPPEGKPS